MAAVVIVGSGAAGLAAALAAVDAGADVALLERAGHVGGTTALSGGVVWAPGNHQLGTGPTGIHDAEDALTYLTALARGDVDHHLMAAFTAEAGRVAASVEQRTALRWEPLDAWPDYRPELPGARGGGRSLWPAPLPVSPAVAALVQPSPEDREGAGTDAAGDAPVVLRGAIRGRALVAALLAAVLDAGVDVRTDTGVHRLRRDAEDRVVGSRRRAATASTAQWCSPPAGSSTTRRCAPPSSAVPPSPPWGRRGVPVTGCAWPWRRGRCSATWPKGGGCPHCRSPASAWGRRVLPGPAHRARPARRRPRRPRRAALRRRGPELRGRRAGHGALRHR